ncbi:MAG: hypothetical protein RR133_02150 [Kiritimatiellia bacterium]
MEKEQTVVGPAMVQAKRLIEQKKKDGMLAIRFFFSKNEDLSSDDFAKGYCDMEAVIKDGNVESLEGKDF